MHRMTTSLLLLTLMGCTSFPELDEAVSASAKAAHYPQLAPISNVMTRTNTQGTDAIAISENLAARTSALRTRAARLRRSVVDAPSNTEDEVQRHSG